MVNRDPGAARTFRYWAACALLCFFAPAPQAHGADSILIGLDADMSSGGAPAGEAIRRGALIAIDEINEAGGALGRPLELIVRNHRGNPARGIDNIDELADLDDLVAILGGLHTPVALAELDIVHERGVPYLVPWAAGTPVVENGFDPNYVFRVSVRDEYAGGFLVGALLDAGFQRPGLLLENTGWGRSNEKAMQSALSAEGLPRAPVHWFNWGTPNLDLPVGELIVDGVDVLLLVANAREGVVAMRAMTEVPEAERIPIVSHWGITGGNFFRDASEYLDGVDLSFLQTFSFFDPPFPDRSDRVMRAYCARFEGCDGPASIFSPVGTAHAYDLIHLLSRALERAGTPDRRAVRDALERNESYQGLVRNYAPAFTPEQHDALDARDFRIARFSADGSILPIGRP
jgi:branched-chain amino acid transport system substrate-binding protein